MTSPKFAALVAALADYAAELAGTASTPAAEPAPTTGKRRGRPPANAAAVEVSADIPGLDELDAAADPLDDLDSAPAAAEPPKPAIDPALAKLREKFRLALQVTATHYGKDKAKAILAKVGAPKSDQATTEQATTGLAYCAKYGPPKA